MRILRKAFSCIIAMNMLLLTGCNLWPSDKTINEDADKIFELIKCEDITQLSELFSDNVKKNHNLEEELQMFFESIDGELVDYESFDISSSSEGYDKEGNLFEKGYIGKFKKVSSNNGKEYYELMYYRTLVASDATYLEGINGFRLKINEDDDSSKFIDVGLSK